MIDKTNPVDLDALDAIVANHKHESNCYDVCEAEKEILDAYPALSAELRRLRGLVREYAEARDAYRKSWVVNNGSMDSTALAITRLADAGDAIYAAGKEIAK